MFVSLKSTAFFFLNWEKGENKWINISRFCSKKCFGCYLKIVFQIFSLLHTTPPTPINFCLRKNWCVCLYMCVCVCTCMFLCYLLVCISIGSTTNTVVDPLVPWHENTVMNKLRPEGADPFPLGLVIRGETRQRHPRLTKKSFGFDSTQRGIKETGFGWIMEKWASPSINEVTFLGCAVISQHTRETFP